MSQIDPKKLLQAVAHGDERGTDCPDEQVVAGYVDGQLSRQVQDGFERHLASCDACIRLVAFLSRSAELPARPAPPELVRRAQRLTEPRQDRPRQDKKVVAGPWSRRPATRRGLATAAGLLLVTTVVVWNQRSDHSGGRSGERSETRFVDPNGVADRLAPAILFPTEGSTLATGDLWIRWEPGPASLFYEVHIVDADGDLVWQTRQEGTEVRVPAVLGLTAGEDYFVRVSAHLSGGKQLRSRHVGFRVVEGPSM